MVRKRRTRRLRLEAFWRAPESAAPAIEIELADGRRLRFARDTDPETIQRLVAALDGGAR